MYLPIRQQQMAFMLPRFMQRWCARPEMETMVALPVGSCKMHKKALQSIRLGRSKMVVSQLSDPASLPKEKSDIRKALAQPAVPE